jgi:hypothetical protein
MLYSKPNLVVVGSSLEAIKSCSKCESPRDVGNIEFSSTSAYEADE